MFRSLFIGFLILSALTAKGTETLVAENKNNMPADSLPGFFGLMPGQTEKNAGIVPADAGKAFFSCEAIDGKARGLLSVIADEDANPAWFEDNCLRDCRAGRAEALPEQQVRLPADEAFYCVSGLSPPIFADNE